MKMIKALSVAIVAITLFSACNSGAQDANGKIPFSGTLEVIQFHSEHRCMTCNKIEEQTRKVLKEYPDVPFSLVNVDEDKNAAKAEEFEASGTALFLYDPKSGKKKDLTDFAFMNAQDDKKFVSGLKAEIATFTKK